MLRMPVLPLGAFPSPLSSKEVALGGLRGPTHLLPRGERPSQNTPSRAGSSARGSGKAPHPRRPVSSRTEQGWPGRAGGSGSNLRTGAGQTLSWGQMQPQARVWGWMGWLGWGALKSSGNVPREQGMQERREEPEGPGRRGEESKRSARATVPAHVPRGHELAVCCGALDLPESPRSLWQSELCPLRFVNFPVT